MVELGTLSEDELRGLTGQRTTAPTYEAEQARAELARRARERKTRVEREEQVRIMLAAIVAGQHATVSSSIHTKTWAEWGYVVQFALEAKRRGAQLWMNVENSCALSVGALWTAWPPHGEPLPRPKYPSSFVHKNFEDTVPPEAYHHLAWTLADAVELER